MRRGNRIVLACIYWAFVLYVFVPLILMILMGFKDSKFIGFPIRSWTFDWYTGIFSDVDHGDSSIYFYVGRALD